MTVARIDGKCLNQLPRLKIPENSSQILPMDDLYQKRNRFSVAFSNRPGQIFGDKPCLKTILSIKLHTVNNLSAHS